MRAQIVLALTLVVTAVAACSPQQKSSCDGVEPPTPVASGSYALRSESGSDAVLTLNRDDNTAVLQYVDDNGKRWTATFRRRGR
jgi:hypothetical protein